MSTNTKTVVAIAVAALLVSAGAANVLAAKPSIDNETTDTASTSELVDGSTINVSDGINDSEYHYVQYTADSENSKVEITLNGTNDEGGAVFYSNSSADTIDSASDTYRVSFSESELADVPVGVNENRTLDVTIINDTSASNPDTKTIQVTFVNGEKRSVIYLSDADVSGDEDDDVAALTSNRTLAGIELMSSDYAKVSGLSRDVDGSSTDVTVIYGNESVADDYSSASASDSDEGDWLIMQSAALDGSPVKVYKKETGDEVEDGESYGVYKSDIGGESGTIYNLGSDDFEDADSVELESYGNKDYSPFSATELFGVLGGSFSFYDGLAATSSVVTDFDGI